MVISLLLIHRFADGNPLFSMPEYLSIFMVMGAQLPRKAELCWQPLIP